MNQILVIGGGPAGMMAAIMAARNNNKVILLEKNNKLGKKLYITGKGRCNITNSCDVETLLQSTLTNSKFLYSAFYSFDSNMLMEFLKEIGLRLKIERGNRVFPSTDKSSDVINAFLKEMEKLSIDIQLNIEVKSIEIENGEIKNVKTNRQNFKPNKVIVATGGLSYPLTGSTGDGYFFAKQAGHRIIQTAPGLVPLNTNEQWVKSLQGLSLKNIHIKFVKKIKGNIRILYEDFGEMLFTHFGISGPIVISGSSFFPKEDLKGITAILDLKPSLSYEQLDLRLLRDFKKNIKKIFSNSLDDLLPKKLIPVIIELSRIEEDRRVDQITKEERRKIVELLKNLEINIEGRRLYNEAIITRGGVDVKEINPATMESKYIKNLYFAGEVLDIDALTGGFNLQIAFSTGYLAGISV